MRSRISYQGEEIRPEQRKARMDATQTGEISKAEMVRKNWIRF